MDGVAACEAELAKTKRPRRLVVFFELAELTFLCLQIQHGLLSEKPSDHQEFAGRQISSANFFTAGLPFVFSTQARESW